MRPRSGALCLILPGLLMGSSAGVVGSPAASTRIYVDPRRLRSSAGAGEPPTTEAIPTIVKYRNDRGKEVVERMVASNINDSTSRTGTTLKRGSSSAALRRVNAVGAMLTPRQILMLGEDPDIEFVEESDTKPRYLLQEAESWGLRAIQAGKTQRTFEPASPAVVDGGGGGSDACSDPSAVRVAIVDSGVDISHPDLGCDVSSGNCVGADLGMDLAFDEPTDSHGEGKRTDRSLYFCVFCRSGSHYLLTNFTCYLEFFNFKQNCFTKARRWRGSCWRRGGTDWG